jgi:DNA polymerase-3 subunit alpha
MVSLAKNMGMPAVAMTDHGNMYGTIEFFKATKKADIKPIIGIEAYIVEHDFDHPDSKQDSRYHLVLLVKNKIGYQNLIKLSSISFIDGFYHKPRISKSLLKQHHEGLICLSGCIKGEIPQMILYHTLEKAKESLLFYKELFGDDFYIELQNHNLPDEQAVMPSLIKLAHETDTQMVVTNDCHYLSPNDAEAHDLLLCINTGKNVADPTRMKFPNNMYFKSEDEMKLLFPDIPQAIENTLKIADKIDFDLSYKNFLLPKVELPIEFETDADYLTHLCYAGTKRKYPDLTDEVKERIDYEISVLTKMGFASYFLVVKDIVDYAVENHIPVGPGRGSAVGSIVSYLLGITTLCPLKYNLFFERFLNPERISMPDIDIDFCRLGREKIIEYIKSKYGRDCVAQIVTFSTLGAKSTIKDVARSMEVSAANSNMLTKLMNKPDSQKVLSLTECMELPDFANAISSNQVYTDVYRYSLVLEGLIRQIGVHAAGVVIAPEPLSNHVPLATSTAKDGSTVIITQFQGSLLDDLKLLKMDILSLNNLTVIDKAVKLIKTYKNIDIDIENLDLADSKAYELLSQGKTDGIFQFESDGMKKYLRDLKPNSLSDLIAMVALYRPGPMQFIDTYINRKHGKESIAYEHPLLANALKETYGVTVYQEQVMQISRDVAGLSGADADKLRKAMGKKDQELMGQMKVKFVSGAQKNGLTAEHIERIWASWLRFAEYAFNKSHACAYAFVAFQTAYLKANFPVEYMTALLSTEERPEKVTQYITEAKKMNIAILRPSINTSQRDFTIAENKILFGFNAIKNVGTAVVNAIINEREKNGTFENYFDFVKRVESTAINKAVLESLIMAGVLDELPGKRSQKFMAIEQALNIASVTQKDKHSGQINIFDFMDQDEKDESVPQLPDVPDWDNTTKLEGEKKILGFYVTGHPLKGLENDIKFYTNTTTKEDDRTDEKLPEKIQIIGNVCNIIPKKDKQKNPYIILELEDFYGTFEVALYSKDLEKYSPYAVIGKKLFVVGTQSLYQGNKNDNVLRIKPDKLIPIEDISKKMRGDITIFIAEDQATGDFATYLQEYKKKNPGRFKVCFHIKRKNGSPTIIRSNDLMIALTPELDEELTEKRNLAYKCDCEN